jgi:hypothetical protein
VNGEASALRPIHAPQWRHVHMARLLGLSDWSCASTVLRGVRQDAARVRSGLGGGVKQRLTKLQRYVFGKVAGHHRKGLWYRAEGNGERVTLASLFRAGLLARRAWRGNEGEADAAHEYRLSTVVAHELQQLDNV